MMTYDEPLEEWGTLLLGIIDKLIEQMNGKVDREFWCRIIFKEKGNEYEGSSQYTVDLITGWLAVFLFPKNSSKCGLHRKCSEE